MGAHPGMVCPHTQLTKDLALFSGSLLGIPIKGLPLSTGRDSSLPRLSERTNSSMPGAPGGVEKLGARLGLRVPHGRVPCGKCMSGGFSTDLFYLTVAGAHRSQAVPKFKLPVPSNLNLGKHCLGNMLGNAAVCLIGFGCGGAEARSKNTQAGALIGAPASEGPVELLKARAGELGSRQRTSFLSDLCWWLLGHHSA